MTCDGCGKETRSTWGYCKACKAVIHRERAERIAELPWYILDRDDPSIAGANATSWKSRPVDDTHHIILSKKKITF